MEFCSGLDRIIAAFEAGRSAGLRLSASERDCPYAGQHQLAEYWLDGFHVGRNDRDCPDHIEPPMAELRGDWPSRSFDDGGPGLGTHA